MAIEQLIEIFEREYIMNIITMKVQTARIIIEIITS